MKFKEYYNRLPDSAAKKRFREKVIEDCRIVYPTFYSWLQRNQVPPLAREKIAEIAGKPENELFPEK